jgi:hypothetical protein
VWPTHALTATQHADILPLPAGLSAPAVALLPAGATEGTPPPLLQGRLLPRALVIAAATRPASSARSCLRQPVARLCYRRSSRTRCRANSSHHRHQPADATVPLAIPRPPERGRHTHQLHQPLLASQISAALISLTSI